MQLYLEDGSYISINEGIDCSIPMSNTAENPTAWYVDAPKMEPVRANGWVGAVAEGGSVNFRDIIFNPHGHCTHTECLGHITPTVYSVNKTVQKLLFSAYVVTIVPDQIVATGGTIDRVINAKSMQGMLDGIKAEALLIRTIPNDESKKSMQYSETNPPYCDIDLIPLLAQLGVKHFLIDTPSVDRENDNGVLAFHHAFWNVPENPNFEKTITELIYVPDEVVDGYYLLNLQMAAFENDATPSRPVLYPIHRNAEEQ